MANKAKMINLKKLRANARYILVISLLSLCILLLIIAISTRNWCSVNSIDTNGAKSEIYFGLWSHCYEKSGCITNKDQNIVDVHFLNTQALMLLCLILNIFSLIIYLLYYFRKWVEYTLYIYAGINSLLCIFLLTAISHFAYDVNKEDRYDEISFEGSFILSILILILHLILIADVMYVMCVETTKRRKVSRTIKNTNFQFRNQKSFFVNGTLSNNDKNKGDTLTRLNTMLNGGTKYEEDVKEGTNQKVEDSVSNSNPSNENTEDIEAANENTNVEDYINKKYSIATNPNAVNIVENHHDNNKQHGKVNFAMEDDDESKDKEVSIEINDDNNSNGSNDSEV